MASKQDCLRFLMGIHNKLADFNTSVKLSTVQQKYLYDALAAITGLMHAIETGK